MHNIVLSHREEPLPKSHFSLARPTPGVLDFVFIGTGGPYLQSACLRLITSSRNPDPIVKLGLGGFFTAPQATFGHEEVPSWGRCKVTAESTLHPAAVEGSGLVALPPTAPEALPPPPPSRDGVRV